MECLEGYVSRDVQLAGGLVIGLTVGGCVVVKLYRRMRLNQARKKWNEAGKDVVVLHQFPRPIKTISFSPFPAKLETFLRMNKIKYICDFDYPMSAQNKSPWITINGQDVPDSQLCIEHLKKLFNINMESHLHPYDVAVARAMRSLMEDHLYWTAVVFKWGVERGRVMLDQCIIPGGRLGRMSTCLVLEMYAKRLEYQTICQGMGRHKLEDVKRMMMEDIKCLSDFLADKPYFTGQKPTELDCVAFGFLSIAKFAPFTKELPDLAESFANLNSFVDRIKNEFYPDWEEVLKPENLK